MTIIPAKPLPLQGALNVRDLGGYTAEGGQITCPHRFLRAAALSELTEEDKKELTRYGVRAVFDLRSVYEAEENPDPALDGAAYYPFPLLDRMNSAQKGDEMPGSMGEVYVGLLKNDGETFAALLRKMLEVDGCVLFHCSAGKDRTGVTAMLLLGAAGASRETILRDYEVTEEYLAPMLNKIMPVMQEKGVPLYMLLSKRENMEMALDWIDENVGSIPGYLRQIGLRDDEIIALAERLLRP